MKSVNSPSASSSGPRGKQKADNSFFISPTYGPLNFDQVVDKLVEFRKENLDFPYRLIIGTDSQEVKSEGTNFVSALIVHRVGQGGIYFWKKINGMTSHNLKQRILSEATFSLELAQKVTENLAAIDLLEDNLEIHVDIGRSGPTREMISEVIGMIRGSGFAVKIKPDAYGAAKVADRHV